MSTDLTLNKKVARLFTEKMSLDVPSEDTDLFQTGAMDSLAFVELLVQLEVEFGIRVSMEDLEIDNFRSTARIGEFIARHNGLNAKE